MEILWVVVIVKSWVNKQAGFWLAAQEWTTNQKPGQQVDPTLDLTTTHKFPLQMNGTTTMEEEDGWDGGVVGNKWDDVTHQGREFMSCSHCQELGQ